MSEKTKDRRPELPPRKLFLDATPIVCDGRVTVSVDSRNKVAVGDTVTLTSAVPEFNTEFVVAEIKSMPIVKRGRPKSADAYPGPSCGMSRAKWYRNRAKETK